MLRSIDLETDLENESCVYKLYCGKKYLIVKGKTLSGSIYLINRGYAGFIVGGSRGSYNIEHGKHTERASSLNKKKNDSEGHTEWSGVNSYYFKFYTHMKANPDVELQYELLFQSNNHYELLKREQEELDKAFSDKNCLNNNLISYIPIYRKKTQSYGWINKGSVLAFKKFLKRR